VLFGYQCGASRCSANSRDRHTSTKRDRIKLTWTVGRLGADLTWTVACAHLATRVVSAGVRMLMGRTTTLPPVTLARRGRTSRHCGHAKAYAVQQYGRRHQYCQLTFVHVAGVFYQGPHHCSVFSTGSQAFLLFPSRAVITLRGVPAAQPSRFSTNCVRNSSMD